MPTLRFENSYHNGIRHVIADCAEGTGGGQEYTQTTANGTGNPILGPSAFMPNPTLQWGGFLWIVAQGEYGQASAGLTQSFNFGLLVDGVNVITFLNMFGGSPITDTGVGDVNPRMWTLDVKIYPITTLDDTTGGAPGQQMIEVKMTMFNSGLGTLVGTDTKYTSTFIDPRADHDIGIQIGKTNGGAFTTSQIRMDTITGFHMGARSGS